MLLRPPPVHTNLRGTHREGEVPRTKNAHDGRTVFALLARHLMPSTHQVLEGVGVLRVDGHGLLELVVPLVDVLVDEPVVEHCVVHDVRVVL